MKITTMIDEQNKMPDDELNVQTVYKKDITIVPDKYYNIQQLKRNQFKTIPDVINTIINHKKTVYGKNDKLSSANKIVYTNINLPQDIVTIV